MPSLNQLLAQHGCLLVLDPASAQVQVGLLRASRPAIWHVATTEAGTGLFAGTDACLRDAGVGIGDVGAFIFCEGPGSILGIRTVAMAVRSWQTLRARPAYAYQSLTVAGHYEWAKKEWHNFAVIADARRDSWHCQQVDADCRMLPLRRMPSNELPNVDLVMPENFRAWAQPPRLAGTCSYDLAKIFPGLVDGEFFRLTDAPDAFQHTAPDYKKWSAQIHSSAAATK